MENHDNIPNLTRSEPYADVEQQEDRQRKRKRWDSGPSHPAIPAAIPTYNVPGIECNSAGFNSVTPIKPGLVFPTSPTFHLGGLREDLIEAYVAWQQSRVGSLEQKNQYRLANHLMLQHGLSLEMLYSNRERYFLFFRRCGVLKGISWHFVCDIKLFLGSLQGTALSLLKRT